MLAGKQGYADRAPRVAAAANAAATSKERGYNTLLVEDSWIDASMIRQFLAGDDDVGTVHVSRTLRSALESLPGEIDLVLLDLGLPDARGIDVALEVMNKAGDIPVVVLTGTDDLALARQCIEAGAQDYLVKHRLDRDVLRRTVEYARVRGQVKRMQESQRHEAMNRLISRVTHDVNNPAAAIHLNTEEMLHRVLELETLLQDSTDAVDRNALRDWLTDLRTLLGENLGGVERLAQRMQRLRRLTRPKRRSDPSAIFATDSDPATTPLRRRVLIVDDDERVRRALVRCLEHRHDVVAASSVDMALSLLGSEGRFDLVVCDLMMPERDGVDFVDGARAHDPSLMDRIVLLTGGTTTERTKEFVSSTRLRVLDKPVGCKQLNRIVDETTGAVARD